MKILQEEHEQVVHHLKNIKSTMDEMHDEGIGDTGMEKSYIVSRLLPVIKEIFGE